MKKVSILFLVLVLMAGCSKTDTDRTIPAIDIDSLELPAASGQVRIKIATDYDWSTRIVYEEESGWLTVTPASGKADDTEITVTVSRNTGKNARSAEVIIEYPDSNTTLAITQTGVE